MTILLLIVAVYLVVCGLLCVNMVLHLAVGRPMRLLVGPDALRTTRPPFRPLVAVR